MIPDDPLDSRLSSASGELREQLDATPLPDFEPRPRVAAPVAFIVALLVGGGIIAFSLLRPSTSEVEFLDDTQTVENTIDDDGTDPDAPDTAVPDTTAPGTARTEQLTIAPNEVELTSGLDATPPSDTRSRPELGEARNDPAYGSIVTRLTDAGGGLNRVADPRRGVINADESLLLTHVDTGETEFMSVVDLASLEQVAELAFDDDTEPTWHPTNPNAIRHLQGNNASNGALLLLETDVATNQTQVLIDLTSRVQEQFPTATHMISGHGRPSLDGNTWVWLVRDDAEDVIGVISYDLGEDRIIGVLDDIDPTNDGRDFGEVANETLREGTGRWLDAIASSDGAHVVVEYQQITVVHDVAFTNYEVIANTGDAADLVRTANGADAYVYVDFNTLSPTNGFVVAVDIASLEVTPLFDLFDNANTSVQISGAATEAPDWFVFSTFSCKSDADPAPWSCNKVMAVDLTGEGQVVPLAHTYNCAESFLALPSAVATADLSAVYFNSDSGTCGDNAEVFEVLAPPGLEDLIE